jgi:hypothetical protein
MQQQTTPNSVPWWIITNTAPASISPSAKSRFTLLNLERVTRQQGHARALKRSKKMFDYEKILDLVLKGLGLPLGWVYANSWSVPCDGSITSWSDNLLWYYRHMAISGKILQRSPWHKPRSYTQPFDKLFWNKKTKCYGGNSNHLPF